MERVTATTMRRAMRRRSASLNSGKHRRRLVSTTRRLGTTAM